MAADPTQGRPIIRETSDGGPCQGVAVGNRMNFAGTVCCFRRLAVPRSCQENVQKNLHLWGGRDVAANGVLLGRKLEMMTGCRSDDDPICATSVHVIIYVVVVVKESIVQPSETIPKGKPYRYVLDLGRAVFKAYPNRGRVHLLLLMVVKLGVFLVQGHQVSLTFSFYFT